MPKSVSLHYVIPGGDLKSKKLLFLLVKNNKTSVDGHGVNIYEVIIKVTQRYFL